MAPRFNLRELRRRSLASFRTSRSTDTSSNDEPSSSSQELSSVGSITPPSLADDSDPALHTQIPGETRYPHESNSNRFSVAESVASEPCSTKDLQDQPQNQQPLSQYAPRLTNITNRSTVYQKVLLVTGVIGQDAQPQINGKVVVSRPDMAFPPTVWPVYGAQFKALLYLLPGPNTICFEYQRPGVLGTHRLSTVLFMFDPKNAPPLQLAIVVAKDFPDASSGGSADVREEEGKTVEMAIRRFRTAAYLWQSFTAEQMAKNGLGRRTFRFDEEWTNGTSHPRDFDDHTMRSEARVHIIRTDKTMAEMRDLENAQQDASAPEKSALVDTVAVALRDYFRMIPGQKQYVATVLLDPHHDTKETMVSGHMAFGGQVGNDLQLAMFGSHCLQHCPSTIYDVVPAFGDCSPTDLKILADGVNVAGSSWEAATYGIGAHLREVGRLLGSPVQETGIMAKDFVALNRAFVMRESYSTRTKSKGGPIQTKDEPAWHRLDLLGYRFHALFRNATDKIPYPDGTVHGWPVDKDKLLVTASSGLLYTQIFAGGDEFSSKWLEHPRDGNMMRRATLVEAELRAHLPEGKRRAKLKVVVRSMGGGELVIEDFHQLCSASSLKLSTGPLGKLAYRGTKVGCSGLEGSEPQEIVLSNALASVNRIMSSITVYHDTAVNGLEFHYEDGTDQLFGKRGVKEDGRPNGDRFIMDIRNAEVIVGFTIRAGSRIDAIQIITSTSRRSDFYGNTSGGSQCTLLVPGGFKICGVSGSCADWLDSFGLLITR